MTRLEQGHAMLLIIVDAVEPQKRRLAQVSRERFVHKMMRVKTTWIRKDKSVNAEAVEASLHRPISPKRTNEMIDSHTYDSHAYLNKPPCCHSNLHRTETLSVSICRKTFPLAWILVY